MASGSIGRITEAELKATHIEESARAEALRIHTEALKEISDKTAEISRETDERIKLVFADAEKKRLLTTQEAAGKAAAEAAALRTVAAGNREAAVLAIMNILTGRVL